MKTIIITLLAALSTGCYAQTSACDELDQAIEYFGKKEIDSAILVMKHVVDTQQSDTTFCYGRCFNNIPLAYAMQGKFDEAQIWFKKILDSDLNDLEQGTDIMEPYANYHHNACMKMVQVSQEIENPHQALKYLELAESTYRFETFSGTSFEKRAVSIAKWKGSIYEELLLPDSAIFVQLHKILDTDIRYRKSDFESLSNVNFYADLITNVEELIGKNNLGKEKKDLKKAIGQLKISQKGQNRVANFNYRGLNYEIGISDSKKTEKEIVSELLENPFFKS